MSIFLDVLIGGVIVFLMIKYCVKGLIQAVLGFGKFIAAVILAATLGRPIGAWISDSIIADRLSDSVFAKISEYIIDGQSLSEFFNNIPEGFKKLITLFGIDISELYQKFSTAEASEAVIREMSETISAPIAGAISAIIAYALIFVITIVILSLILSLIKKVKVPILTSIDKILGLCLGMILGLLCAATLSTIIYTVLEFVSASSGNGEIMNVYNDSYVFKFIYDLNIFNFIRGLI